MDIGELGDLFESMKAKAEFNRVIYLGCSASPFRLAARRLYYSPATLLQPVRGLSKRDRINRGYSIDIDQLNGIPVATGEFGFVGSSMGSVVGEKITSLTPFLNCSFNHAILLFIKNMLPVKFKHLLLSKFKCAQTLDQLLLLFSIQIMYV